MWQKQIAGMKSIAFVFISFLLIGDLSLPKGSPCYTSNQCAPGLFCVQRNCTDIKPECEPSAQCTASVCACQNGSYCDAYFKKCVVITPFEKCNGQSDCQYYERCDASGHVCILKLEYDYCYYSEECQKNHNFNYYCDLSVHKCKVVPSSCIFDEDCTGTRCPTELWMCLPPYKCLTDYDCGYISHCNLSDSGLGNCELNSGRCINDSQCPEWEECLKGSYKCLPKQGRCNENADCTSGECGSNHSCVQVMPQQVQTKDGDSNSLSSKYNDAQMSSGNVLDIVLIIDNSGSMAGNRLDLAKNSSIASLDYIGNADSRISLIKYNNCSTVLVSNFTSDRDTLKDKIRNLSAGGATPIAKSLEMAYSYLKNETTGNRAYVLLFSDGSETCSGDPCAVVKDQKMNGSVPIYTIGYMVGSDAESQLSCIANESGGEYFNASTADSIKDVFTEAIKSASGTGCQNDSDCAGNSVCINSSCLPSKLHIVYVPVNANVSDSKAREAMIDIHHSALLKSLPSLENCTNYIKKDTVSPLEIANITHLNSTEIFDKIKEHVKNVYGDSYDYIIALTDTSSFSGSVAGYTFNNSKIVLGNKFLSVVTQHEMGHKFGLMDEYCSCPGIGHCDEAPNPLKADLGCDVNGDCCWEDFRLFGFTILDTCPDPYGCTKCCNGNKNRLGGRSIMSWADADGPRYHDNVSLDHLLTIDKLRCN